MLRLLILIAVVLSSIPAIAHHSIDGNYDESIEIEIKGVVSRISWRNPHVSMQISVTSDDGVEALWEIETTSLSALRRRGMKPDFINAGDEISVYGIGSRSSSTGLHAYNLLLANGEEITLQDAGAVRWPEIDSNAGGNPNLGRQGDSSAPELGIFRVWSLPTHLGGGSLWKSDYPLTESARQAWESFDLLTDSITASCEPKGMPTLMEQPYPLAFERAGDNILLRIEEYDSLRTIHLAAGAENPNGEQSRLGYSVGEWDDRTLVVTTTDLSWRHFNGRGIPISEEAVLVERFTPSEDGNRLDYEITITDALNFTAPVTLNRSRLWYPDAKVEPYECNY